MSVNSCSKTWVHAGRADRIRRRGSAARRRSPGRSGASSPDRARIAATRGGSVSGSTRSSSVAVHRCAVSRPRVGIPTYRRAVDARDRAGRASALVEIVQQPSAIEPRSRTAGAPGCRRRCATPGSVGSTRQRTAPVPSAAARTSASTAARSDSATSSNRVTPIHAQSRVARRSAAAATLRLRSTTSVPMRSHHRPSVGVRPALPRHLPPGLRAGQRPRDRDGVGVGRRTRSAGSREPSAASCLARGPGRVARRGRRRRTRGRGPDAVTTRSMTNTSATAHADSSLANSRLACLRAGVRDVEHGHRHETVNAAVEWTSDRRHARGLEASA